MCSVCVLMRVHVCARVYCVRACTYVLTCVRMSIVGVHVHTYVCVNECARVYCVCVC